MCPRVHQEDEDKLKAIVTSSTSNPETDDDAILPIEVRETVLALLYGFDPNLGEIGEWERVRTDGNALRARVVQATAANLKATVTQAAKDRTVTNDIYANLKGQVKLTDGTNTVSLIHNNVIPVCTQDHLSTLSVDYAGAQADGIVLSPGATESIQLHSVYVSTNDKLTNIELNEETSDDLLFKLYTDKNQLAMSTHLNIDMVAGKDLLVTCGAGTFLQICYVLE